MRYLKRGVQGPDVEAWGNFLLGIRPCSGLIISEVFTARLDAETRLFQKAVGLGVDGSVGPMTLGAAMGLGFDPLDDEDQAETGPNWPPRPAFGPLSLGQRLEMFEKFSFVPAPTESNPEGIRITDDWAARNIERPVIPQLVGVPGAPRSGSVYFHRQATEQLRDMFAAWEEAGLSQLILGWAGSWVPRFIRGSRSTLSNHAWATAFDINVPWNYLGSQPALKGTKGSVRELVPIANEYGFFWGGHFSGRPDGMHFEVARLL